VERRLHPVPNQTPHQRDPARTRRRHAQQLSHLEQLVSNRRDDQPIEQRAHPQRRRVPRLLDQALQARGQTRSRPRVKQTTTLPLNGRERQVLAARSDERKHCSRLRWRSSAASTPSATNTRLALATTAGAHAASPAAAIRLAARTAATTSDCRATAVSASSASASGWSRPKRALTERSGRWRIPVCNGGANLTTLPPPGGRRSLREGSRSV
jgi:hypothetical protein